ncbi:MAG TPA: iron-sulfur cluster repair di-iron protein [Bryobacteraceae bacterium]|nr:iron-sulfur cluster repair di-iron protein [Bryobacteraceae bacterium]
MQQATEKTVREIAAENPSSVRVFEKLGIDYCCGGRRPLAEACAEAGVPVERALDLLANAAPPEDAAETAWNTAPFTALTAHIVARYHETARNEIPRIEALAHKVKSRHGSAHPELSDIGELFLSLAHELSTHMMKEEQVLFPFIERIEAAEQQGRPIPAMPFGSVARPIAVMTADHDDAGALLARIRELSSGFAIPDGACPSYRALYSALEEFERDMHRHIHLENNILFPRAIAMEADVADRARAAQ